MKPITKYTERTLIPGEQIIYAAKLHNFAYVFPIFLLLLGAIFMALPLIIEEAEQFQGMADSAPMQQMSDHVSGWTSYALQYLPPDWVEMLKEANEIRQFVLGAIFVLFGTVYMLTTIIKKISTEQVITNKKIILKKGFIQVDESEISLSNVEGAKVAQTVLDRMIGRGNVIVNGVGMEQLVIKGITDPNHFRHTAYTALDKYAHRRG